MLFDRGPKETKQDLFDRRKELAELSNALEHGERLIIVYGIRRIGKTSLIKSFLSEKDFLRVFLDIRQKYFIHRRSVPAEAIYESLMEGFTELLNELGISSEEQINILSASQGTDITSLLLNIDKWCSARKSRFIFVLDEAQYLRFSKKIVYDGVIAWAIDNLKSITFILSGSEVGLLNEMLSYEDVKAPLYGRFRTEIVLKQFSKEESKEFLIRGFNEQNEKIKDEEIEEVLENIGGLTGWLSYYGFCRTSKHMSHKSALAEVFEEGAKTSMAEIETLIKGSKKRYMAIMNVIASDISSWSEIRAHVSVRTGKISDSVLDKLLSSLIKFSIIEKDSEGRYRIVDPILKRHLTSSSKK